MDILTRSTEFHAGLLCFVVAIVLWLSRREKLRFFFRFAPPLLLVFLIPLGLTSSHLLPNHSPLYTALGTQLLPACLAIFLMATDMRMVFRIGRVSLFAVVAGACSVFVAGVVSFGLCAPWLGEAPWRQAAPLISAWVGGYPTMLAAKESVGLTEAAFAPVLITASVLAYTWMALLTAGANWQPAFDRWTKTNLKLTDLAENASPSACSQAGGHLSVGKVAIWVATAMIVGQGSFFLARLLPSFPPVFGEKSIGFLLLLFLGLALSMIPSIRNLFDEARPFADYGLLLLIAASGARCAVADLARAPMMVVVATLILIIHAVLLIGLAKLFRIPLAILATASQANIGGVASAPIVANAYRPGSETVGLVMGIVASQLGFPVGLLAGHVLNAMAGG